MIVVVDDDTLAGVVRACVLRDRERGIEVDLIQQAVLFANFFEVPDASTTPADTKRSSTCRVIRPRRRCRGSGRGRSVGSAAASAWTCGRTGKNSRRCRRSWTAADPLLVPKALPES